MLVMGVAPMLWLPTIEKGIRLPQLAAQWKGSTLVPESAPESVMPQTALPIFFAGEGQR
jgi:hypothetical protein